VLRQRDGGGVIGNTALVGFCAAVMLALASVSAGQTVGDSSGGIEGLVTDRTGAALTGVTIRVTGTALMIPRSTVTDAGGVYRLLRLPPGEYAVTFNLQGFNPLPHEVRIALGQTLTLSVVLDVAASGEQVIVGRALGLDRHATSLATTVNREELASLPGSRNSGAILAASPAIQMTRHDVGGSTAFGIGVFSGYGFGGFNRPTLEGISLSGFNPFMFPLDYGSFEEVRVGLAAHTPEWPTPGVHMLFITKSGGNQHRGSFYAAYEDDAWHARNIDADQIARAAPGAPGSSPTDANRIDGYHDFNADAGGFIRKDRVWWYFSGRQQQVAIRRVTFPSEPIETRARSATAKVSVQTSDRGQLVVFGQRGVTKQPIRLDGALNVDPINESKASTAAQSSDGIVWKAEWNATVGANLGVEARVGAFLASRAERPNGAGPRVENVDSLLVRGGNRDWEDELGRDQLNGSLSYFGAGPHGRHDLKAGGEIERQVNAETWKRGYPGDVLHVLNRGAAAEVYLYQTPSRSESGVWWYAAFAQDSWQVNRRVTINLGVRFDRYRIFLPAQEHPSGRFNAVPQSFAAADTVMDWNVLAPRVGASFDLTGDGRTILKPGYGRYHLHPADFGFNVNPNARTWFERYDWTDLDGSGLWDPGEEGALLERRGGAALDALDPDLKLAYVEELTGRIERELGNGVSLLGGVVWRGIRQQGVRAQSTWPFEAFTVVKTLFDPGPGGATLVPTGDGPGIVLHDLPLELAEASGFVVRNVSTPGSDYLTWEAGVTRRFRGRWSFASSFTYTRMRDQASGYLGQVVRANAVPLTPNDFINTDESGRHVFGTWAAKVQGTFEGPWQLWITPLVRHQSGQPFGRTVTADLDFADIRVLAEPVGSRRQDNVTIVDLGVQKRFPLRSGRHLGVSLDVFNLLNGNPEQTISWRSGPAFLRPLNILPPRVARIGVRMEW
jgi:hypothetical protein